MKRIPYIYGALWAALLAMLAVACDAPAPEAGTEGSPMLFYVKQQVVEGAASRAIIEDTDDLIQKQLSLYVNDNLGEFAGIEVSFEGSGVWRNDKLIWNNQEYILYAYVKSPEENGGITVSNNGKSIQITQPTGYSADAAVWADFLLSYRVSANGADRPLVQIELERVTAGVELYVSYQANTAHAVQLTGVTFSEIRHEATMNLSYHATPSDLPQEDTGMKNVWGCIPTGTTANYRHGTEADPISIKGFDGKRDKYDTQYRVMRFLTIPQSLSSANTLEINYQVQQTESDPWEKYTATFDLSRFTPREWTIGHKTRYYLNIDTSVQLEAVVEKWNTASYIEGTFLPD